MDVPAWNDFVRNKNVAPSPTTTRQIFSVFFFTGDILHVGLQYLYCCLVYYRL